MQQIQIVFLKILFLFFISSSVFGFEKTVTIFDIKTGMHFEDLPSSEFMLFACGTNGGPPSRVLKKGFSEFEKCEKEDHTQLREVYFEYDDEALYWAKAKYEKRLERFQGTKVLAYAAILSLLFDDEVLTGGSMMEAIRILKDKGARRILAGCTHGIFSGQALQRIDDSPVEVFATTNTIPLPTGKPREKIEVLSVARLLSDSIKAIHHGESVSRIVG